MNTTFLCVLLVILIIIAVLLFISISKDEQPEKVEPPKEEKLKSGGGAMEKKKVYVIDGLNYIYDKFLTSNQEAPDNENLISNYPNLAFIWKALTTLRAKHKKDYLVFVIKNRDGYKMSHYEDKLFKRWSKTYKICIIFCYDPNVLVGPHYIKGRDDKTVCEIFDKYKSGKFDVELISKDAYSDRADFGSIPEFKKIIYGTIPMI
jgi:hypothetical protein